MKKYQQTLTLNNGVKIPRIGFGTYQLTDPKISIDAIKHALESGYLMLDSAEYYQNHHLVAQAIKESNKRREEIFITTKIWPNTDDKVALRQRVQNMLKELNTSYLDLVLVHWPLPYGRSAYQVLEEFYHQGVIRAIGVSNYDYGQLQDLLEWAQVLPAVNQIELHPDALRQDVINLAKKHNIAITSWQTLMKGRVGELPHLVKLAEKYQVDPAAVALNWAYQQNIIVIPKSQTKHRIESNLYSLDQFNLTDEEIKMINQSSKEVGPHVNSREYQAN